jgi:hypothetical protein
LSDLLPFRFDVPLRKSKAPERHHGADLWCVDGIASTEHKDQQEERVLHKGMDFRPYLDKGAINWNHGEDPKDIIGEPLEGRIIERSNKPAMFYTKGFLYDFKKSAQDLWEHINGIELAKSKGQPITRNIGWSVQGGVVERAGNDIVKSVVRHMALTHEPVNPYTWAKCLKSLAKSLAVTPAEPLRKSQSSVVASLLFTPCQNGCLDNEEHFAKGFHGMLDHLSVCHHVPVPEALNFVKALSAK